MKIIINAREVEVNDSFLDYTRLRDLAGFTETTKPSIIYEDSSSGDRIQYFPGFIINPKEGMIFHITCSVPGVEYESVSNGYYHVVEDSYFWSDLTQLIEYLKYHPRPDRDYLTLGLQNTIKNGYSLKKTKPKVKREKKNSPIIQEEPSISDFRDYQSIKTEGLNAYRYNSRLGWNGFSMVHPEFKKNPYELNSPKFQAWNSGYSAAEEIHQR